MRRSIVWAAATVAVFVSAIALLAHPSITDAQPSEEFTTFYVDTVGENPVQTALMVNLGGRPFVSYHHAASETLKLAEMGFGGAISTAPVTDVVGFGEWSSLGLADNQYPRISFYDNVHKDLLLASLVDDRWSILRLDGTGDVGQHTSLAIDTGQYAHVTYDDTTNGTIKYARQGATGWLTETIIAGTTSSLAVDQAGVAHVSYYDTATKRLRYAVRTGGVWTSETVDASGDSGQFNAIALDTLGRPHIAFYEAVGKDLLLASKGPAVWSTENVDTIGDVGKYVDLFIDNLNRRLVSYQDMSTGAVKYGASTAVGIWGVTLIDDSGGIPTYTSIGYRGTHRAHLSYYAKTVEGVTVLKMAGQAYPTPTPTTPPEVTPGTATPTPTRTSTAGTATPTRTGTPGTPTATPSRTGTPGPGTPSVTPQPTHTLTPGPGTPSVTPGTSPTPTLGTPSVTPSVTSSPGPGTPTIAPHTATPVDTPTATETLGPGTPSATPTATATDAPLTPSATPVGTISPTATEPPNRPPGRLWLPAVLTRKSG